MRIAYCRFCRKNLEFEPRFHLLISTFRPMHQEPSAQGEGAGAAAAFAATALAPSDSPQTPLLAKRPLRILAADDLRINRELIRRLAEYFGYEAEIVENGAEALAALDRSSFDLILLDVQMPVMDGLDAAREIVRRQPDPARRPRILAVTASASAEDRETCLAAGMDDCLVKPISPRAFKACVDRQFSTTPPAHVPAGSVPQDARDEPLLIDFASLNASIPGLSPAQLAAMHRRMYRAVTSDFEAIWPRVVEAANSSDNGQLAAALHALKGCFSTLGWSRIAGRCAAGMHQARAQQFAEWSTFPGELQQLYAASAAEMERYLAAADGGESVAPAAKDEAGET